MNSPPRRSGPSDAPDGEDAEDGSDDGGAQGAHRRRSIRKDPPRVTRGAGGAGESNGKKCVVSTVRSGSGAPSQGRDRVAERSGCAISRGAGREASPRRLGRVKRTRLPSPARVVAAAVARGSAWRLEVRHILSHLDGVRLWRRPRLGARRSTSSEWPSPQRGAVSNQLMPASSAAWRACLREAAPRNAAQSGADAGEAACGATLRRASG